MIDELNLGSDVHTTLEILNYKNVTAVAKDVSDDNGTATILAAHFPEGQWWMQPFRSVFSTILSIVIVVGMIAAAVLLLLAAVFTRRLNKVVMEPLEILSEGAQRVENGNLTEPLSYSGETEFEQVCQAFNNMQATILSNQQRSQQAEEARRDMIAGISHDLRTPLTNVQGYIKGIMDGVANTPEKQQTYLQVAYDAAGEMDRLLQKLFDFSRMESGQMPFHFVTDDLTELTAAYIAQKEMAFSEGNIQFVLDARTMWGQLVSMDVDQIRRIFDNLLENSIKYAGVQPVIIRIAVYQQDGQVFLDWQDNGKGVAEDKIEHIFDRFYRCDAARSEKGSGIGLYVVRYIMEQHGGSIIAENDKGLRLRLCFPERSRDGKNTDC